MKLLYTSYHILGQSAIFIAAAKVCRKVEIGVGEIRNFSMESYKTLVDTLTSAIDSLKSALKEEKGFAEALDVMRE